MRPIKFRAWHEDNKIMSESFTFEDMAAGRTRRANFNGSVIMQFTGLLDKNGKEIYEGDIVKGREGTHLGEVIYGQYKKPRWHKHDSESWHIGFHVVGKGHCFSLEDLEWYIDPENLSPIRGKYLEIIGNIYENPELLK